MSSVTDRAKHGLVVVPELSRETLSVIGADAKSWLNGIVTCDVAQVTPARGAYGLLLTKQGKIHAELDVIEGHSGLLLGVGQGLSASVRAELDRYLVMEDAELDGARELAWLRLHGPLAATSAQAVTAVGLGRIDWLGTGGCAVVVARSAVDDAIAQALAAAPGAGRLATAEEWEFLRLSAAFPMFGIDFTPDDNPHEAGLDRRAVSWSKGCYLGQEVVCMQDMRGKLKRRLQVLELEGDEPVTRGAWVTAEGAEAPVGEVTSSARDEGRVLAFVRLRAPFFEGKSPLRIGERGARIAPPLARD